MEKWLYTAACLETEICRRQFPKFCGHAVDTDRRGRVRLRKKMNEGQSGIRAEVRGKNTTDTISGFHPGETDEKIAEVGV